jgi:glucose/arabinose dehydrogenase
MRERMSVWSFVLAAMTLASGPAWASTAALQYQEQTITVGGEPHQVRVPSGYVLEVLTTDLSGPRLLSFGPNGDLFIGSHARNIYRVPPPYTHPEVLVRLKDYPHSVAFRPKGNPSEILIARTGGLYRAPYRPGQAQVDSDDVTLLAELPGDGGHNSRTVSVGPDGRVYLSLGISGNCSDQYIGPSYRFEDRRGGVIVLNETGGKPHWEPYATGLRNPIGLDWQPGSGVLYASNNGPDHWGYDLPPEYFVRITPGEFYGMPWFQFDGRELRRDDCVSSRPPRPASQVSLPVATFPARSAPMGVAFVPEGAMDQRFTGDAVVALHGSWGTKPSGGASGDPATRRPPKLVIVRFDKGKAARVDDLVTGFQLATGSRWARPVGVAIGPDGALYFTSDSEPNALFRLRRAK